MISSCGLLSLLVLPTEDQELDKRRDIASMARVLHFCTEFFNQGPREISNHPGYRRHLYWFSYWFQSSPLAFRPIACRTGRLGRALMNVQLKLLKQQLLAQLNGWRMSFGWCEEVYNKLHKNPSLVCSQDITCGRSRHFLRSRRDCLQVRNV